MNTIEKHHKVINKHSLGIKNSTNNDINTNREDNNNNNNNNNNNDRLFDFAEGELRGGLMSIIIYVLKIKSTLRAPAMKEAISKYNKSNIYLKYRAMINIVTEIEKEIAENKELLVCVEAEVDAVDLEEKQQESMTVDNDNVKHAYDDIATL